MSTYHLELDAELVAAGIYNVSVRGCPGLEVQALPAASEVEAKLRAATGLAVAFVIRNQG